MKIGFIGLGKLGLPCALAIERLGHSVMGNDISERVLENVRARRLPYREDGAHEALQRSKLRLASAREVAESSDIIFVAIQTPHEEGFEGVTRLPDERVDFDYSYLIESVSSLAKEIEAVGEDRIVVIISTVLPGTIRRDIMPLLGEHVKLCYNPFFIAMGTTMRDFLEPEFVLLGVDDERAASVLEEFYSTLHDRRVYRTTIENAELVKVSYNTFIGMKIVFANTIMEISHKIGADADAVTDALKLADRRLMSGAYMSGGMGDGGGCHPRDNIALSWLARELDLSWDWFESLMLARERQTEWMIELMEEHDLPKVVFGKSFKPETNITVGSPSVLLKNLLEERGHEVTMYDPYVDDQIPDFGASVFLIGTKHPDFACFDYPEGSVIIDPWRYVPDRPGCSVIRVGGRQSVE